jgi:uncharacterized membrane protein
MSKGRLEAFSDGVLAILITIMVLELAKPRSADLPALQQAAPSILWYLLSFVFVGIYWNNHHHMFAVVRHVNGWVLWANLHLLFWLSLVPFATDWLGQTGNHLARIPTLFYGAVLLASAMAYTILVKAILHLEGPESPLALAIGRDRKGRISLACYVAALAGGYFRPWIADVLFVAVACMWIVPDRRIERRVTHASHAD